MNPRKKYFLRHKALHGSVHKEIVEPAPVHVEPEPVIVLETPVYSEVAHIEHVEPEVHHEVEAEELSAEQSGLEPEPSDARKPKRASRRK